eukprot:gene36375-biopygen3689
MTDVAIKELLWGQLSHDAVEELKAEAQTMRALRHPNIVQFLGYSIDPRPCIVMEYMPRGSLHKLLRNRQVEMSWDMRMRIALDITRGLIYLHAVNIVHRDIKSMNVLLTADKACLADFGLARVKTETRAASTISVQAVGTLRWMAPELFSPRAVFTRKSDVYSLGFTLWELATRELPFEGTSSNELIGFWVRRGYREDIPEDCPAKLASAITSCWHADPTCRPEADAVATLLMSEEARSNASAGLVVPVMPPSPPPPHPPSDECSNSFLLSCPAL